MATSACWRFPASPQYVAHARHVVAAYARWLGADPSAVALAVSEAFTNAVVHAYRDMSPPGEVQVSARRCSCELEIRVSDDGRGISASDETAPWPGLGLNMIDQISSHLEVHRRAEGGTVLSMSFPLA